MASSFVEFLLSVITVTSSVMVMTSEATCPEMCRCLPGNTVDCMYGNLATIPHGFRTSGGSLDLSFNNIQHINRTTLQNITDVRELRLYRNGIVSIADRAFSHLDTLRELDVGNNNVTELSSYVFTGLSSLETLYFDANDIVYVAPLAFIDLTRLTKLDIQWNELTVEVLDSLYFPSTLREIDLAYNKLIAVRSSWFPQLTRLSHLYLGGNPIVQLTSMSFGLMPALRVLHIGNKELRYMEQTTLGGLYSLSRLSIAESRYHYFPVALVGKVKNTLRSIDVGASPIASLQAYTFSDFQLLNSISLVNLSQLQVIHSYAFYNLSSLQDLIIKKCPMLRTIEEHAFSHLPLLTLLDLSGNGLLTLTPDVLLLPSLADIKVTGNNWRCRCSFVNAYQAALNPLVQRSLEDDILCSSPDLYSGYTLNEVMEHYDICAMEENMVVTFDDDEDNPRDRDNQDATTNRTANVEQMMAPLHTNSAGALVGVFPSALCSAMLLVSQWFMC